MRMIFTRWILVLMYLFLLVCLSFESVSATQGVTLLEDPYPPSDIIAQISGNAEKSVGLILGAALIVVVIFGGVIFRRIKS